MRYTIQQKEFDTYELMIYVDDNTELFYTLSYDEICLVENILQDIGYIEETPNYMS